MKRLFFALVLAACAALAAEDQRQKARDLLDAGYADKNPDTRVEVASVMGLIGTREKLAEGFETMLKDKDYKVRSAVVRAMGDLNDKKMVPLLEQALKDSVAEVAFSAAKILAGMHEPAGKQALLAVYRGTEKGSSGFIASAFRDTARQFESPRTALLFGLRQGVGYIPVPGLGFGYTAVEGLILDPNFSPRASALLMLASDRSEESANRLRDAFVDKDWSVRAVAVQSLAMYGHTEDREEIAKLFEDKKDKVRFRAAAAYLRLWLVAEGAVDKPSAKPSEAPAAPPKP